MRQVLAHPFSFYSDIQEPRRIRWIDGLIVIALVYLARMVSILLTGYAYETREPYEISYMHEMVWLIVPWLTWCIANWGVSAILDGEGKFKEVFVGSAYALVPYAVLIIPVTLLTNILALDESSIYTLLLNLTIGWSVWLMLVKIKIVHDFEPLKVVWITLLTLAGIAIIWFIGILMFGLINQLINFVLEIVQEVNFRR
nr:Yip1 family protein [Paenibacillus phyllosphaerae]